MTTPDILQIFNDVLRYKEKYEGQLIVMKFGGALAQEETIANIARQAAFLQHNLDARVILVHGGGIQIDERLKEKKIKVKKDPKTGLRITDADTLNFSDQALRAVNGRVISIFNKVALDVRAIGMAGYEGRTITAQKAGLEGGEYTGHVTEINTGYLGHLMSYNGGDLIPVIYPICHNVENKTENRLNVNADEVAGALASRLNAKRLILCSDIPGVLDKDGKLIPEMSVEDVDDAIDTGVVTGGMIQKLRTAAHAAESLSSGSVVIVDGRTPGSILGEFMYDKGTGTLISKSEILKNEAPKP